MTGPAEILTRLQAAWTSAAGGRDKTPDNAESQQAAIDWGTLRGCAVHLLPFDAIEERDPKRLDYIRSKCRRCGRFIGYRRTK